MKPGMVALFREGRFLWYGKLGEPLGADADTAMVAPPDYDGLLAQIQPNGRPKKTIPNGNSFSKPATVAENTRDG